MVMRELKLELPAELMIQLEGQSERLNVPLNSLVRTVLAQFLEDEALLNKAEFLVGLRESMEQVLAGDYRPAREVLEEIERDKTKR